MLIVNDDGGGISKPVPIIDEVLEIDKPSLVNPVITTFLDKYQIPAYMKPFVEKIVIPQPTVSPIEVDTSTPSSVMTDEEIRLRLIDDFYLKYDVPIIPYWDLALTANWNNLNNRIAFIEALKKEIKYLYSQPNGTINKTEQARIKDIIFNIAKLQVVYEEAPEFIVDRAKEAVSETIKAISLATKIGIGVSIAGVILFGGFVGYNYLKSYGTELGIKQARD